MNTHLQIAIQAAIEAGEAIMEIYQKDFEVEFKADDSPLTEADQKANRFIMRYLDKTEFPIISEENKQTDYQERKNWTSCWIVDPLDGTKEFIKKNGEFTVNIALVHQQKTTLGVIYVPATKVLYYADASTELAQKVQLVKPVFDMDFIQKNAEAIQPKEHANNLRIVGSRSHMNEDTTNFIDSLTTNKKIEVVSKGSSLKFCLVADGDADIYPRFAPTMEWDTAAGQAICKAVGLQVIDQKTGKEMLYNRENLLNNYFMVSNQK
ncbi:3'(2'),5'-bisphosphate nucleotidase CysQ [Psychroflexus planctonicus]|uniref:3'(2'),5'-bisphosphate nucleotidase CysQ n=1 Tax=Psychroflexus planctonicus TaxID=1526575 RepID=A0ABQ1SHA7_9FLAO|nr:3'(2'),5'-bisphosphate nucleotidase CysQ [Psychroflexus planctonicus]GGE32027.1 3'(2'),5'-bisphosphate nucleotidase CysQ [Psychroflexus planctonicus]